MMFNIRLSTKLGPEIDIYTVDCFHDQPLIKPANMMLSRGVKARLIWGHVPRCRLSNGIGVRGLATAVDVTRYELSSATD